MALEGGLGKTLFLLKAHNAGGGGGIVTESE